MKAAGYRQTGRLRVGLSLRSEISTVVIRAFGARTRKDRARLAGSTAMGMRLPCRGRRSSREAGCRWSADSRSQAECRLCPSCPREFGALHRVFVPLEPRSGAWA